MRTHRATSTRPNMSQPPTKPNCPPSHWPEMLARNSDRKLSAIKDYASILTKNRGRTGSGRNFDVLNGRTGFRDRFSHLAHHLQVGSQSFLKISPSLVSGVANSRASRYIGGISGVPRLGFLDYQKVALHAHPRAAFFSVA